MRREIDGLEVCIKGDAPALVSLVEALGAKVMLV
jgi:erythronate-4-phosphate dehydrogenase